MGDLISIDGRRRSDLDGEEIVDCLSRWLEMAKRGEIQSLAMTCIRNDDAVLISSPRTHKMASLIGAVALMQQHLILEVEEIE